MSIKPILFNTDMVRAILDGRKTVTRRKIDVDISNQFDVETDGKVICYIDQATGDSYKPADLCRYQPEDILYVRETQSIHRINNMGDKFIWVNYKSDGSSQSFKVSEKEWERLAKYDYTDECYISPYWTTHETARIWLKVTNVRVERLQDMNVDDVIKEGVFNDDDWKYQGSMRAKLAFELWEDTWNSTIKKSEIDSYGQDANPWVWAISFERCEKPQEENKNADK